MDTLYTHVELFSGIGSATIAAGLAKLPFQTIVTSEICKHAHAVRSQLVNDGSSNFGDITDYSTWADLEIEDLDLVSAGFPCQSFSLLGKQLGWSCPKVGKVTQSIRDFVNTFSPKYILMENVTAIVNSKNEEGTKAYLDSFKNYKWDIIQDNPNKRGFIQSRGRVYIVMSRRDVPQWTIDTSKFSTRSPQTWHEISDKRPNKNPIKGEYMIINAKRVHSSTSNNIVMNDESTTMNCWTRTAVDAHCNRFSYIAHGDGYRCPSAVEGLKAFGHKYTPRGLTTKDNISRSSFFRALGNSWHLETATAVFSQFPLAEFNEWNLIRFVDQFINMEAVELQAAKSVSEKIRALFSWEDLMTTPKGSDRRLTATSSHKFDMRDGTKIRTQGMYLSPAHEASLVQSGININTCPNHALCAKACLNTSGQMKFPTHVHVRVGKTRAFYAYPLRFLRQVLMEVIDGARIAHKKGDKYQYRLNGTSDLLWERFIYMDLMVASVDGFNGFYDYTKMSRSRLMRAYFPETYHLTFSVDEKTHSSKNALAFIRAGLSVAIVMTDKEKIKLVNMGFDRVIDGDDNDHRPQDPQGAVVVLRAKGDLINSDSPFIKSLAWVLGFLNEVEQCIND